MKKFLILLICVNLLNAQTIEVKAKKFFADEKELYSDLNGSVMIKKGDFDRLWAENARIYFNEKKEPKKYIAKGDAKFEVLINGKHYEGRADVLSFIPGEQLYIMSGNAYLHEVESDKKIFGEIIEVNQENGTYEVKSQDEQPVKMIFQIKEK